jgi:predicted MPP superfamily phosphohydrolase
VVQLGPRLAWLTDIHLNFVSAARAAQMCDEVLAAEPDAVLLGGDIGEATDLVRWLDFLDARLPVPIYFVLGNHDFYHGRFAQVHHDVAECVAQAEHLVWLERSEAVELTERCCLVGHGGWGDARLGDYDHTRMRISDFMVIGDLMRLDHDTRRERLNALGDEAAEHLRRVLPPASSATPRCCC